MRSVFVRWLLDKRWGFCAFVLHGFAGGAVESLPQLLYMLGCVGLGTVLAAAFTQHTAISPLIAIPVTIFLVFLVAWAVSLGWLLLFFPFPPCRNGKCRGINDYLWPTGTIFGHWNWGTYFYRCNCGDVYLREGKRFLHVLEDGTRQPYLKLVRFRTWEPDSEREEKDAPPGP